MNLLPSNINAKHRDVLSWLSNQVFINSMVLSPWFSIWSISVWVRAFIPGKKSLAKSKIIITNELLVILLIVIFCLPFFWWGFFVIKSFICIYWKISACAWNQIAFSRVSFQWLLEKKKREENFKKLNSKCQEMGKIRRMETVTFASHVKHSECQDLSGNAFFKCISFW